jgi:hypothetical protein
VGLKSITAKLIEIKGLSSEELEATCLSIAEKFYEEVTFEDGVDVFDYIVPDITGYFFFNNILYKVFDIETEDVFPYAEIEDEEDGTISFEGLLDDEEYLLEDLLLSAFSNGNK